MSTSIRPRVQAGTPAGGQFAASSRDEAPGPPLLSAVPDLPAPPAAALPAVRESKVLHRGSGVDKWGHRFESAKFESTVVARLRVAATGRPELVLGDGRTVELTQFNTTTPNPRQALQDWLQRPPAGEDDTSTVDLLLEGHEFALAADDPVVASGAKYRVWPSAGSFARPVVEHRDGWVRIRVVTRAAVVVADGEWATGDHEPPF